MDLTVYMFMFPVCIAITTIAMLSGISGAAMLSPAIILGFPLLGASVAHLALLIRREASTPCRGTSSSTPCPEP